MTATTISRKAPAAGDLQSVRKLAPGAQPARTQSAAPSDNVHLTAAEDEGTTSRSWVAEDGTRYTETVTTAENGDQVIVVVGVNGTRREETRSEIVAVDGDLEDWVSDESLAYTNFGDPLGPTRRTTSVTTVTDTSVEPAKTVVVADTTSYSQDRQPDVEQDGPYYRVGTGVLDEEPLYAEVAQPAQLSGKTTVSLTTDNLNGDEILASETRLTGTGDQGQVVELSTGVQYTTHADGSTAYLRVDEQKGNIPRDAAGDYFGAVVDPYQGEFGDRLEGSSDPYVSYRRTVTSDPRSPGGLIEVQEFGDYDRPLEDGRTVTAVRRDGQMSLTYNLVSENGARRQSQTVVPGTDFSLVSDFRFTGSGTYHGTIRQSGGEQSWNAEVWGTPEGETATFESDGEQLTFERDGTGLSVLVNGQVVHTAVELGADGTPLADALAKLASGSDSLGSWGRLLGPAALLFGLGTWISAEDGRQQLQGASATAEGVGAVTELFSTGAVARGLARSAGVAGGVLLGGLGIYELTQGEYGKGALHTGMGLAAVAGVLIGGPVGLVLLAAVGVAGLAETIFGAEDGPEQPQLEF